MNKKGWGIRAGFIAALLITIALLASCSLLFQPQSTAKPGAYQLRLYMLDVGQGDSLLLESAGQYMLVDAGENDQGDRVVQDLKTLGVTKLAAVVGTHPHSDHIGGLDKVIKAYPVDAVYMPKKKANDKTYEDVLDAVAGRGLKITVPKPGDALKLGDADLVFLWPPAKLDSDDTNDCSIVIKATAGGRSALLCGDIEKDAEKGILDLSEDVSCDVLKVAHHGSDTSSTKAFLSAANPSIALISVGNDNSYKHPSASTVSRLTGMGVQIHRTDRNGIITVTFADGKVSVADSK